MIAVVVASYFRLQSHRSDAVAMANYRKLAEEAVANQQELRDQLAKLTEHVQRGRAADAGGGLTMAPTASPSGHGTGADGPRRAAAPATPGCACIATRCGCCLGQHLARGLVPGRLRLHHRLAAVQRGAHHDRDGRLPRDHAGRHPAAGRGGGGAARVRRRGARRLRRMLPGRSGRLPQPDRPA